MSDPIPDFLKGHTPKELAAWYLRVADLVDKRNSQVKDALAPRLLRHYVTGKGTKFLFDPPDHLKKSKYVVEVLKNHKAWYLTEKPWAPTGEPLKLQWVGMIPRLQGKMKPQYERGSSDRGSPQYTLKLNTLVEIPVKDYSDHTPGDADLMTALRGFQMYTFCFFTFFKGSRPDWLKVDFGVFSAQIRDRYDFDGNEYFPIPNPDFRNPDKLANPIAPDFKIVVVFHRNAHRMEKAGLAAPFEVAIAFLDGRRSLGVGRDRS